MEYGHNRYIVQINFITTFVSQKVRANERGEEKAKKPTFFFFFFLCFFLKKNVIYTTFLQQILSDRLLLSMLLDTHFMVAFAFSFFFFFFWPTPLVLFMRYEQYIKGNEQYFVSVKSNWKLIFLLFSVFSKISGI